MADKIATVTGNFLTAGTWGVGSVATNASNVGASNASEAVTTSATPAAPTGTQVIAGNNDVVDGVALWFASQSGSPTGTLTVRLRNITDSTNADVTINCSDLPANSAWMFFKFGSSQTITSAKNFAIQLLRSTSVGTVNFNRFSSTASDWHRTLRRTTTGAVAAGERIFVCGEWTAAATVAARTVTMDETSTATDYGAINIGQQGTITFKTTATSAIKTSGVLNVWDGGTLSIGTSGTPIGAGFTATLQFDCTVVNEFGLIVNNGGTFHFQGASKTLDRAKLTANCTAAATTVTVDQTVDTLWSASDIVAIAQTTRSNSSLSEARSISSFPAGNQITVSAGFTNFHAGTAPHQADVINLTRNAKIRATTTGNATTPSTSTLHTYVVFRPTANVDMDWAEICDLGSVTSDRRGLEIETTASASSGVNINRCAIYNSRNFAVYVDGTTNDKITITNNVFFNVAEQGNSGIYWASPTAGTAISISGNIMLLRQRTAGNACIFLNDCGFTCQNNVLVGAYYGLRLDEFTSVSGVNFDGNTIYCCGGVQSAPNQPSGGLAFTHGVRDFSASSLTIWRCGDDTNSTGAGVIYHASGIVGGTGAWYSNHTFTSWNLYGNVANIYAINEVAISKLLLVSCNLHSSGSAGAGDTAATSVDGVRVEGGGKSDWEFNSCNFGTTATGKSTHTNDIRISAAAFLTLCLRNTRITNGASGDVVGYTNLAAGSYIRGQALIAGGSGVNQRHRSWFRTGKIQLDTGTFHTAAPSQQLMPASSSEKLESGRKKIAMDQGNTVSPKVWILMNAYSGALPRLVVKANAAMGISADTVLATATSGLDVWKQLSASATAAVTDDGILEFVVDCDGLAGSVFVEDWSTG